MSALSDFQDELHRSVVAEAKTQAARLKEAIREANEAVTRLPLAGTTRECPKCLFGMLTYRYKECAWWGNNEWSTHVNRDPTLLGGWATRKLIVRTCPQCGADCFERPADSINDYQQETA